VPSSRQSQVRYLQVEFKTRDKPDSLDKYIEGYFAVYGKETELWPRAYEEITRGAFSNTLTNDIRALTNHDSTLVLGRNRAGTLELKDDEYGLWGSIQINYNDTDAMNVYERVKRGDVSGCSFGFNITSEETEYRDDGSVKWYITGIDLHEVSVCTFPAYEQTSIIARQNQAEELYQARMEQAKQKLMERVKQCLDS